MVIGQVRRPAVMHHDTAVAGDDADVVDGRATAFPVQAFDGDLAAGIDMDPVVLPIRPERGLIGVQGWHVEQFLNGRCLPTFQRRMQAEHELQYRCRGDGHIDQRLDRLQHPVERDHLGDQQIHHVGLEAIAVLQGAVHVRRESSRRALLTPGAVLDLRGDVMDHLLEQNVDPGASLPGL